MSVRVTGLPRELLNPPSLSVPSSRGRRGTRPWTRLLGPRQFDACPSSICVDSSGTRVFGEAGRASEIPFVDSKRVCSDNAVLKLDDSDGRYPIDLDFCTGCEICVAEFPSGAIQIFPEEI